MWQHTQPPSPTGPATATVPDRAADSLPNRPVWLNRSFLVFWTGQAISLLGDAVGGLALPLLVLKLTGSALQVGAVAALLAAPLPLLSLPAGALVDRLDRRRTMIVCDSARAILFVALAAAARFNALDIRVLYTAAVLLGTLQVVFYLAGQSAVPSLVPRGRIVQANSWVQAASAGSGLLGLPIAGLLIAALGAGDALVVDGLSFVVSAFSLAAVRRSFAQPLPVPVRLPPYGPVVTHPPSCEGVVSLPTRLVGYRDTLLAALRRVIAGTFAGLLVVWRTPALRAATALTVGLNLILSLGTATGLFRLRHDLNFSPTLIGFILGGASAGAIVLALAAGPLRRRLGMPGALLLALAVEIPVALGIGWATSSAVLGVSYALSSGAGSLFSITTVSLRQTITPAPYLGRVSAAVQTIGALVLPIGTFLGGVLTQRIGASLTYTAMAGALAVLLLVAVLGGLRRLDATQPAVVPPEIFDLSS
jgi:MFS family permease